MPSYEYELLNLQHVNGKHEHVYEWHSDRHGKCGEPLDLTKILNARGQDGWHIGTHVVDARWGNMIVLERSVGGAPVPTVAPIPVVVPMPPAPVIPDNKPELRQIVAGLQEVNTSLILLQSQLPRMAPSTSHEIPMVMNDCFDRLQQSFRGLEAQVQSLPGPASSPEVLIPYLQAMTIKLEELVAPPTRLPEMMKESAFNRLSLWFRSLFLQKHHSVSVAH